MGDGRYYSIEQFWSIFFYSALIIFTICYFMISLFNSKKNKQNFFELGILLLIHFLYKFNLAITNRSLAINLENKFDIIIFILNISFIARFYFINKDKLSNKKAIFVSTIAILSMVLVIQIQSEYQYIISILYFANFIIITQSFSVYSISSRIFKDIKDYTSEYIFIIDDNGYLIFKNKAAEKSKHFKDKNIINIKNIADIFISKTNFRNLESKQILEHYFNEEKSSFQYNTSPIIKNEKTIAHIITFVEITSLLDVLDQLEKNKNELSMTNQKLEKYKEIVYEIETEKNINEMMNKIVQDRVESMKDLKPILQNLDFNLNTFDSEIKDIIDEAKNELKKVRETVNAYIKHYEGE